MTTFIVRLDDSGTGVRVAVKDLIDMAGLPTTAGSRAVAATATPATSDAACLAGTRAANARIVGRTNLHELALGVTGINPWYGTPTNPLDPTLVPGGSSSGSAVAVADGDADVAFGSDTGGSIRIPAACCGVVGLKTTWGRVSLDGVWPLAPSFDTVGPMGRDVGAVITGMALLEPGFEVPALRSPLRVGRVRVPCHPAIDDGIDAVLGRSGLEVIPLEAPGWSDATVAAGVLLVAEAWTTNKTLALSNQGAIGADVMRRLHLGRDLSAGEIAHAEQVRDRWRHQLSELFTQVDVLVAPTLTIFAPRIDRAEDLLTGRATLPANLGGVPALALPIPTTERLPASLQLLGPLHSEALLLGVGLLLEAAARA
ncbi:MAG: amidase [Acidimicrobiales bacterium]